MARTFGFNRNFFSQPTVCRLHSIYKSFKDFLTNFVLLISVLLFMVCLFAVVFRSPNNTVSILLINTERGVVHRASNHFLSIGLDSSLIADGFLGFDMKNPRLIALTKRLSPGVLRIGGTLADRLSFIPNAVPMFKSTVMTEMDGGRLSYENQKGIGKRPNFTMSGEEWLQLNDFARRTGFVILFDLNSLLRSENGSWDGSNAESLIQFSDAHNLSIMWQLGNEPNAFRSVFNYNVNATQLAKDFHVLRNILNKYSMYKTATLVGPDTTRPLVENDDSARYLLDFLRNAKDVIDVVSWHQYYMNGRTASIRDFINPYIFNLLEEQVRMVSNIVCMANAQRVPIWLTETASAYGGGAPGYSNSFIGTFIWLDKLGLAAKYGLDLVVRQSIFKGHYALIGWDYEPTPDWWISLIYKRTVSPKVVSCNFLAPSEIRLYCHCASNYYLNRYGPAITVFGMNMRDVSAKVRLQGIYPNHRDQMIISQKAIAYVLSPYYSVLARSIKLNGIVLQVEDDFPPVTPSWVDVEPYLSIPPYSLVFWIVPNSAFEFCLY